MQRTNRAIGLVVLAILVVASLAQARELSFEQRVAAQRAIEQVYYRHQTGTTKPFEEAVPRVVLEAKVHKYLDQTAALEIYWKTRVTDEMLERELERMSRGSRLPDRLQELFAALGNDPFLIKECLARATLVGRLARNFYAFDTTLHAQALQRAEELHRQLATGALDPSSDYPDRSVVDLVLREPNTDEPEKRELGGDLQAGDRPERRELSPGEFRKWRARAPDASGSVAPVAEEREAFVIRVVLSEASSETRVATYVVPKTSWDVWWERAKERLPSGTVTAVASDDGAPLIALRRASLPCADDDTWDNGILDDIHDDRYGHTAVWTGSVMVFWGGYSYIYDYLNTGGRYDPATDSWTPTSTARAPSPRLGHTAVWTGSVMVVWGGYGYPGPTTGGRYDPATDTWTAMSTAGAHYGPPVWTGSVMVVWGGYPGSTAGGRYDPAADKWTKTSTVGAPSARYRHTAVWTGSVMVVWGGGSSGTTSQYLDTGGRYDPVTDTWTQTSTAGAPSGRNGHAAVWTGDAMVVWGGYGASYFDAGGRYDPATDTWTAMSTVDAPFSRYGHTAVWTGSVMVVWGGSYDNSGGRYDPATDMWTATSTVGAPSGRVDHTAVWTGSVMVVWGGEANGSDTGGRYVLGASVDNDGDGYSECGGDCNDGNAAVHPGAPEVCDGIDNDCDGAVEDVAALCNDGNVCTTDTCHGGAECTHVNNTLPCDDGNACTVSDSCSAGACHGGPARGCNDGNVCTADVCVPPGGCAVSETNLDSSGFSANRVDGRDLVVLALAWNSCPRIPVDPRYNASANLDRDACIDLADFHLFMIAFGHSCPDVGLVAGQ